MISWNTKEIFKNHGAHRLSPSPSDPITFSRTSWWPSVLIPEGRRQWNNPRLPSSWNHSICLLLLKTWKGRCLWNRICGSNWSIQSGPPSTLSLPYPPTPVLAFKMKPRTVLVVQWLRIHLPTQGTSVKSLDREGSTCHGATKPTCCNCWAHTLEPVLCNKRSHRDEKPVHPATRD